MPPPEPRSILAPCLAVHTFPAPTTIRCIPHPIAQPLIWPPLAAKVTPFFAARNSFVESPLFLQGKAEIVVGFDQVRS
jgi:hypothetical protein